MNFLRRSLPLTSLLVLTACGGEGKAGAEGSDCGSTTDCQDGYLCLSIGERQGTCAADCSVSADACGSDATCAGVGSVSIDVCQPRDSVPSDSNAPEEDERASLPCVSDDDCTAIQAGLVCGTWRGWKECTLPCDDSDACNPSGLGFTTSFMTCGDDEGEDRTICIPDEDCFDDPMSCLSFQGF